ncbi:MAG: thiamine pyrophosphate-dependent enzyme, partial [Hyphomicrobiales bacterium]
HLIHACRRNLKMTCLLLNNEVYGMTGGQVSPTTSENRYTTTTPLGNTEPVFDTCKLAAAAGASFVGREATLQTPTLQNLIKQAISHNGYSLVEIISDCTEIYGRKNDLGNSPEMILSQKAKMRPENYHNTVDRPFRPNPFETGVLTRNDRPEYLANYRAHMKAIKAKGGNKP